MDNREDLKQIGLVTMSGGDIVERFNAELEKLVQNIDDPDTDPGAKREINLKMTFLSGG